MGMTYSMRQASDATLAELQANPEGVATFLFGEDLISGTDPGFFDRILGKSRQVDEPAGDAQDEADLETCELDKAWHGIHYLLTGSADQGEQPPGFLLNWGDEVGEDLGYGPARAYTSDQVAQIAGHLSGVTDADLRSRFDPDKMMNDGIYPTIWDRDPAVDDALGYVLAYFKELKEFISRTHARGYGMVACIC